VSEPLPAPRYRTGALWTILLLFLLAGTVAAAYMTWSVWDLLQTGRYLVDIPVTLAAGVVATLCLLFLSGILYRVDRLRGVPHREVALFE
jgi:hypothetical protein